MTQSGLLYLLPCLAFCPATDPNQTPKRQVQAVRQSNEEARTAARTMAGRVQELRDKLSGGLATDEDKDALRDAVKALQAGRQSLADKEQAEAALTVELAKAIELARQMAS